MDRISAIFRVAAVPVFLAVTAGVRADSFLETRIDDSAPHLRVGVSVRKIRASFAVDPSAGLGRRFDSTFQSGTATTGRGDPGLFLGGPTGVVYDDGQIDGETGGDDGNASGMINSLSQLAPSGRPDPAGSDFPLQDLRFHSSETSVSLSGRTGAGDLAATTGGLRFEDEAVVSGVYAQFVFPLASDGDGRFLNFLTGYSHFEAELGTGRRTLGSLPLDTAAVRTTTTTNYEYRYDYLGDADAGTSFPYSTGEIVYDPILFASNVIGVPGDYLPPSRTAATTTAATRTESTRRLRVVSWTEADVDLHEIPFGFECGCRIGPGTLAFNAGATLNVVDVSVVSGNAWYFPGAWSVPLKVWTGNKEADRLSSRRSARREWAPPKLVGAGRGRFRCSGYRVEPQPAFPSR